jgi:hypothetical protein
MAERTEDSPTCLTCKHYDLKTKDPHDFEVPGRGLNTTNRACRRYPTVVYKGPAEWCGEHRT